MSYIPILTHALERDIDLLLVEELACSPDFVAWLLRQATGRSHEIRKSEVLHSCRRMFNRREIDITVRAETDVGRFLLLLENKLDADEQPDQALSYREEAEVRADAGLTVLTGLISPKDYMQIHPAFTRGFDVAVPYEEVESYFIGRATCSPVGISARLSYRAGLIRQAIQKERRGYQQVIHPARRAFSKRYVELLEELAPELVPGPSMLRESAAESMTMIFASETLPPWPFLPQMRIVHQLREGNANLNFYTWGERFEVLSPLMRSTLEGFGFRLVPTVNRRRGGKASLKLLANTPVIDQFGDFDAQEAEIRAGILAAKALREWLVDHENDLRTWAVTEGAF